MPHIVVVLQSKHMSTNDGSYGSWALALNKCIHRMITVASNRSFLMDDNPHSSLSSMPHVEGALSCDIAFQSLLPFRLHQLGSSQVCISHGKTTTINVCINGSGPWLRAASEMLPRVLKFFAAYSQALPDWATNATGYSGLVMPRIRGWGSRRCYFFFGSERLLCRLFLLGAQILGLVCHLRETRCILGLASQLFARYSVELT